MSSSSNTSPSPSQTPVATTPPTSGAIIVDHTSLAKFTSIPAADLHAAALLSNLYFHRSTGDNIDFLGLQCLSGQHGDPETFPAECITYAEHPYDPYDNRNWDWEYLPDSTSDAAAKVDLFVSLVHQRQQDYQVLGMKFCYIDGWNQYFDYYRQKMEALQKDFPAKTFIWTTSAIHAAAVVNEGSLNPDDVTRIHDFNTALRAYAATHNIVLYDLAAIESHLPDGSACTANNGVEALCDEYYTGYGGGGGGHPNIEGSIRLAKGYWMVMARIAGWDGSD